MYLEGVYICALVFELDTNVNLQDINEYQKVESSRQESKTSFNLETHNLEDNMESYDRRKQYFF